MQVIGVEIWSVARKEYTGSSRVKQCGGHWHVGYVDSLKVRIGMTIDLIRLFETGKVKAGVITHIEQS